MVGVSVEGPEVGAGLGALLNVRSTPGGVVQLSHGPNGETVALTHDVCGRVIARRVEGKGFRPKTWRYGWDALDRLVSCLTPEGASWFYRYDSFGRRLTKVRRLADTERAWVAKKHPALVSAGDREATVLWTWPQAPNGHAAHDPRPPIVGTHFLWDGDVIAEEAPLRLDGSIDWDDATRWHFEPESFVPVVKQMPDGRLAWIVTDHLGTPREMFDEAGGLRWAASLTTWGVVRKVITPPEPANDDGRTAIYIRSSKGASHAPKPGRSAEVCDCPIRFQGQRLDDETGLNYNRYRHYDPVASQYVSFDPIGLHGGWRPRAYVIAPTSAIDPLGLSASIAEAGSIRDVNKIGGNMNCVNCSIATDATLAGRPASALGGGPFKVSALENVYKGKFGPATNIVIIERQMASAGKGARGIVFGSRGKGVRHVFNVVNQGGTVRFLDGQTGGAASLGGFESFRLLRTN